MNIIANQPIKSIYTPNSISHNSRPAFTAKPKLPAKSDVKKGLNIAQKLYNLFFVPSGEKLKMVKDDHVFTEMKKSDKNVIFAKKYKFWSKQPEMIVRNDMKSGIQTKVINKGEVNDVEIRDIHTPGYEVSVGYKNVSKDFDILSDKYSELCSGTDYKGDITIKYGDKKINLSNAERERIYNELNESVEKKYDYSIKDLMNMGYEKFQEFETGYYKDPEVIGRSILGSPNTLEHQVNRIVASMPYGIEEIMKHVK